MVDDTDGCDFGDYYMDVEKQYLFVCLSGKGPRYDADLSPKLRIDVKRCENCPTTVSCNKIPSGN